MLSLEIVLALLATGVAADAPALPTALPGVEGGVEEVLPAGARAGVVVFFRAGHDRSLALLSDVARCQARLEGKPVRWLGVVTEDTAPALAREAAVKAGARIALAIDRGQALYGALGLKTLPTVLVVGPNRKVAAMDAFRALDGCDVLTVRVRRVLGEATDADVEAALSPPPSALPGDDPSHVAHRHLRLGEHLLETGKLAKAHEEVRKALFTAPSADAWALEGDIFVAEKDCPRARKAFENALKLSAQHARALAGRARCP